MANVDPEQLTSAEEMLDAGAQLDSIDYFEISARVDESDGGEAAENVVPQFGMRSRIEDDEFLARLHVRVDLGVGTAVVDVAASYTFPVPVEISEAAALEFVNKVALMALIPYARQALADTTQRVFGEPLALPIVRQGELEFAAN